MLPIAIVAFILIAGLDIAATIISLVRDINKKCKHGKKRGDEK